MDDPDMNGAPYPFPDYGTSFFSDCLAGTNKASEKDLSSATFIDLEQGGVTLSTAVPNGSISMVFTRNSG
ncbi:hypothetical protein EJ06DRAFT_534620 [Trichodelitschia bisporula]|uniref:Uncharacterized protein n=1 Tax=Trichodelitschia bisporula TaxID=703511 RepID=A0A6G1HIW2_9PEZI|nr:hypothetical protein EJ06DRAFT_534620 [Trichodelitschia bisporula]